MQKYQNLTDCGENRFFLDNAFDNLPDKIIQCSKQTWKWNRSEISSWKKIVKNDFTFTVVIQEVNWFWCNLVFSKCKAFNDFQTVNKRKETKQLIIPIKSHAYFSSTAEPTWKQSTKAKVDIRYSQIWMSLLFPRFPNILGDCRRHFSTR